MTAGAELPGDPVFARPADGWLADVFEDLPRRIACPDAEVTLAFGPGTALVAHDRLWYLDVPKHGRDLVVGEGAWLSSFVIVVGPCSIGEPVVVGVGSLVLHDVARRTVVAGSPATPRKVIPHSEGTGT